MSTKIGALSDTHGLLRDEVIEALRSCDVILPAGDINKREIVRCRQEITLAIDKVLKSGKRI